LLSATTTLENEHVRSFSRMVTLCCRCCCRRCHPLLSNTSALVIFCQHQQQQHHPLSPPSLEKEQRARFRGWSLFSTTTMVHPPPLLKHTHLLSRMFAPCHYHLPPTSKTSIHTRFRRYFLFFNIYNNKYIICKHENLFRILHRWCRSPKLHTEHMYYTQMSLY